MSQDQYQVTVLKDKCISAASCVAIAPNVFSLDKDKIVQINNQNGEVDQIKLLAAQSCPTGAIVVTDKLTGKQLWPIPK